MTTAFKAESVTITYLRGLASLGVVIYHVREDLWIGWKSIRTLGSATLFDKSVSLLSIPAPYMGSGVILFFLLSGFCIALPYVGNNPRMLDIKEYGARRFFRIYPPYIFAIVLTLIIELILQRMNAGLLTPVNTYLTNIAMIQNYTTGALPTNGVLWTLPIEIELYISFPIVLFLLHRFGIKILMVVSCIVSLSALGLYLTGHTWLHDNFAMYWLIWTSGAVLADYYAKDLLRVPPYWVTILGILSLAAALFAQTMGVKESNLEVLYGCFYFALLWLGLTTEYRWSEHIPKLLVKLLTILGTCSYSLYLIHKPIFRLCGVIWINTFGGKPVNFLVPLVFTALIIPIALFVYHLIESPSHKLAKKIARAWRNQPQGKV
jgi:peptidoglycan/LPS O-acetylase OafA/YrhL